MKKDMEQLCECIKDAKEIIKKERLMDMQSHVLNIAFELFDKRHTEKNVIVNIGGKTK